MKGKTLVWLVGDLVLWLMFINFGNTLAQTPGHWQTLGPIIGKPEITTLLADSSNPAILFAGTAKHGVYRSKDFGLTWQQANAPMNDKQVTTLLLVDNTLYAGTASHGIFISTDEGTNWMQAELQTTKQQGTQESITSMIWADGIFYAGTGYTFHGVLYSLDKGMTWNWSTSHSYFESMNITTLLSANGVIYAGTTDSPNPITQTLIPGGVWYSRDKGITWGQAHLGYKKVTSLISLDEIVFAGTGYSHSHLGMGYYGLFYSKDGGAGWNQTSAPMNDKNIMTLISKDGTLYAGTGYSSTRQAPDLRPYGVFYSRDKGVGWTQANAPMDDKEVTSLVWVDGTLCAGAAHSQDNKYYGVFYSRDKGENWTQARAPMNDKKVTAMLSAHGILYAGTDEGVFRSTNHGVNWFGSSRDLFPHAVCKGLIVNLNFIFTYGDIPNLSVPYRSTDGGINWTQINPPLNDKRILTAIAVGETLYVGTYLNGVYRSTDGGVSWTPANAPMDDKTVTTLLAVDGKLYAGTELDSYGVYFSTDGGLNWTRPETPIYDDVTTLLYADGKLYAGTNAFGVFYSTDEGMNWIEVDDPIIAGRNVTTLLAVDQKLYAGTEGHGVFWSTDGGINWVHADVPLEDNEFTVTTMISVDGTIYVGTSDTEEGPYRGIFRSSDGGVSWFEANDPLKDKEVVTIVPVGETLYAAGGSGVFRSTDRGVNWVPINSGLGSTKTFELSYLPELNRLYAATQNGVYFQTLDNAAPIADSIQINSGNMFTKKDSVTITLYVNNTDADSMILAQDPNFTANSTGWEKYDLVYRYLLSGGDGSKTVYAKFKDISYNESNIVSAIITLDKKTPEFLPHSPPTRVTLTKSVKINQQITESHLDKMILHYRRGGEPFSEDRFATFRADTARIDGVFITNRGIDYRIFASDLAGNKSTLQNGTLDFFSIPVELNANDLGSSPGLPAGTGGSSYRLVSVPMKLSGAPSVKTSLGIRGKYGKDEDWRFWIYQGNDQWREGENIPLQNGEGYFLILRNGGTLTNKVAGTTMETTAGVLGTIPGWRVRANDWTIIGNPYNTRIELSQLKLKGQNKLLSAPEMSASVWMYEGSSSNQGWTNEGIALERWSGLAIYSTREDTIVFANSQDPYAKGLSKSSSPITESLQENEWLVQIRGESGDYSDNVNYFGVRKEASAEQDLYDWYEPPTVPGGISVNFPHAEWQNPASFTSDIRPVSKDGCKWQIRVNASGGTAVTLNFNQLETVPNSFEVLLLDESNRLLRDLRTQPQVEVRIPQESDTKNLVILVGKQDFVQSHTTGMRTIPQSFALQQNYPNPFWSGATSPAKGGGNPTTVIRYELPVAGKVTLKLYNLLGTEVVTLENDEPREPGYYEKVVDLRNFASGIYFYRISVSGEKRFEATKKMILTK